MKGVGKSWGYEANRYAAKGKTPHQPHPKDVAGHPYRRLGQTKNAGRRRIPTLVLESRDLSMAKACGRARIASIRQQ